MSGKPAFGMRPPKLALGAWAINKPTQERLLAFVDLVKSYQIIAEQKDAFDVVEHIARSSGLIKLLSDDKTPEGISRYENVQELLNGIKDFVEQQQQVEDGGSEFGGLLQDVALLTDADRSGRRRPAQSEFDDHSPGEGIGVSRSVCRGNGGEPLSLHDVHGIQGRSGRRAPLVLRGPDPGRKAGLPDVRPCSLPWGKLIDCEPAAS